MVTLAAVAVYANTVGNGPVLDDGWVIFSNPLVQSLKNVAAIFRQPYGVVLAGQEAGLYRPITTLTYAINYALGGSNVLGYHVVNIALHALCSLVVLRLGQLLMRGVQTGATGTVQAGPLLGALLFAVHPVHTEAVTAMVGRAELLAALGSLCAIYLACTRGRGAWRYPTALVALVLAVLSKENAAVTPLLFSVIALTRPEAAGFNTRPSPFSVPGREALWRLGALAGGMAAAAGLYFVLRPQGAGLSVASQYFGGQPAAVVFYTMTRVIPEYLRLLVFPHPLAVDFYYQTTIGPTLTFTLAGLAATVVWVAVLAVGAGSVRRAPMLATGILWVFSALLPVLNILPIGTLMAERFLYLPSVGFCLAAGAGAVFVAGRLPPAPRPGRVAWLATVAVALLALGARTWVRNGDWRNALTLWQAEVRKAPTNSWVNNNLAMEYVVRGDLERARERLEIALQDPRHWRARINMGIVAHRLRDDSAAIRWFEQAHELAPSAPEPDLFLATVLAGQGQFARAVDVLARAAQAAPTSPWPHLYRATYLKRLGLQAEADAELKRALELDPSILERLARQGAAGAPGTPQ